MFNEWFQNLANIKFQIDLDTFRDDPSLSFAWELTRAQAKKPSANELLLTYLSFERSHALYGCSRLRVDHSCHPN